MTQAMNRSVLAVCDSVGDFIEWWGFKNVHGRTWAYLALRREPVSQAELARVLGVSRALVNSAVHELMSHGLVEPVDDRRNAPWRATMDVWPVIANVLRSREWMLIERTRLALEACVQEGEAALAAGEPLDYDLDRLRSLLALTDAAQRFVRLLVSLRVPKSVERNLGDLLVKSSRLIASLRRFR